MVNRSYSPARTARAAASTTCSRVSVPHPARCLGAVFTIAIPSFENWCRTILLAYDYLFTVTYTCTHSVLGSSLSEQQALAGSTSGRVGISADNVGASRAHWCAVHGLTRPPRGS